MLTPVEFDRKNLAGLGSDRLKESAIRREAERARKAAHKSALRLTERLLTYPHREALQEAPSISLPDGREVNVRLINTGEFNSLDELLQAQRSADCIEVSIRYEKGTQYGYSVLWNISDLLQLGVYREYHQGLQLAAVFNSAIASEGYTAYVGSSKVNFDPTRQCRVYTRCKEIFDIALTSLNAHQSSQRLP